MHRTAIPPQMRAGEFLFRRCGATVEDDARTAGEDTRLELLDGVLIMHSPANVRHENLFWFVGSLLRGCALARNIGTVLGSRTPVHLPGDHRLEPDLLFVAREHLPRLGETALEGAPDLGVETLSPATRDYDMGEKRRAYAAGGVPESWMIDLRGRQLLADRPAGHRAAGLAAGHFTTPVLAGFWLEVSWLWQDPPPDSAACLAGILAT